MRVIATARLYSVYEAIMSFKSKAAMLCILRSSLEPDTTVDHKHIHIVRIKQRNHESLSMTYQSIVQIA